LLDLLPSWERAMRAERKSPATIKCYGDGVRAYARWADSNGIEPQLSKADAQAWIADTLAAGKEGSTAKVRLKGMRRFCAWLVAEGELAENPMAGMPAPKVDDKVVPALSEDQLKRLLKACVGKDWRDRRDEAIVRLMLETGARASEVVGLQTADVDLDRELVTITRGKGGKGRVVPIGPQTVMALDRYLRARRARGHDSGGALWVGYGGSFGYYGLSDALKARARAAGIEGFHLHLLRHTFATRWKAAQGSDDGLMAVAGWSSRSMIDRYAGAAASQRAAEEARRLGLGDL
jgi:site-specific recombinase XerD